MFTQHKVSLRTYIVGSIFAMSLLGVFMALVIGSLYRESAINNQQQHLEHLIKLQTQDILSKLTDNSRKLGETLQNNKNFRQAYKNNDIKQLNQLLESQYHQYFVTAGITRLQNLSIYDTNLKPITNWSSNPINNNLYKNQPCGNLITHSKNRLGANRIKTNSELCNIDNQIHLSVLIPIGGIFENGYIEIITDPSYNLQKVGLNLGLPVKLTNPINHNSFLSNDWPTKMVNGITPIYNLTTNNSEPGLEIAVYKNLDTLEKSLDETRNIALAIAFLTTILAAIIFLSILQKTMFNPLNKLSKELKKILHGSNDFGHTIEVNGNAEISELSTRFNEMVLSLKDTYGKIELARDGAIEANKAKSQFLANMSHELRTPLNAVIGYSELLNEDPRIAGNEDITSDLSNIHSAANHLLKMIDEVLDLSKIEAGKMELSLAPFNANLTIMELCDTIVPLVNKNNNKLIVDIPADINVMYADITKFRQTLYNILSNACKFTENGEIKLDANRYFRSGREWFIFTIKDTGIGISEENLKKLFNAFNQGDNNTSRKYGGTGLGLAISKRFCNIMGGDIVVSSKPGKGTTFTISLPAKVERQDVNKVIAMDDYITPNSLLTAAK